MKTNQYKVSLRDNTIRNKNVTYKDSTNITHTYL